MDGYTDKSTVNHFINFASEAGAAIDKEMTENERQPMFSSITFI